MINKDLHIDDEAAAWFARIRRGSLSAQDMREFEGWKRQDLAHQRAWSEVCSLWNDPAVLAAAHAVEASGQIPNTVRPFLWRRSVLTAAAFGLVAAMAFLVLVGPDFLLQLQADDWTAIGEQRTLQLPDGSSVTLNTKTAIATEFAGPTRGIRLLAGEAFFTVSPDPHKPFIVESHNVVARALGTADLPSGEWPWGLEW